MMLEKAPRPFDLPEKPVDRFRVEWWEVRVNHTDVSVVQMAAVYHVNSTWAQVCPDDAERHGADFVNHWQLFEDGSFCARTRDGWTEAFELCHWTNAFRSKGAALAEGIRRMREKADEWRKQAAYCARTIEALEAQMKAAQPSDE